jgi:NAD(P)-dependent dehydrogenase (short-subunit alcohol dehydrogenase family)
MAHYAASKGGVIGLTKALAVELARQGITVSTIPPSLVDTPADIAADCSFLCSDGASYITGQLIGVNGGMYI